MVGMDIDNELACPGQSLLASNGVFGGRCAVFPTAAMSVLRCCRVPAPCEVERGK